MDSTQIARLMSTCTQATDCSCAEAAGAMVGVLARLQSQLTSDDFNYLVLIGGVLFREGMREFEGSKEANEIICRARKVQNQ
jgi:hypothetical protein